MRLALYQPDIPQNTGAILRLAACLAVAVDVIEPCGFAFYDKRDGAGCDKGLRRAALDYLEHVALARYRSWPAFLAARAAAPGRGRLVLFTTGGDESHVRFAFRANDVLLMGRESAGAPAEVHAAADARLVIPMAPGLRSLNVALAAAIALGEALRQTDGFPGQPL